ncbi:cell division protein FtsL [Rhodovulum sp. YNF3179]|uniref:cell division protein FtsL n=1 Tax=Rhodovulum sp. YNF3179 TaxID=3425127 RepID=UPI003D3406FC
MRGLIYVLSTLAVIALAYWAYHENYQTQQALREVKSLQRQIGDARERLAVLRAEWAYLNRPERLRDLSELNFPDLQLMPLAPEHFGSVAEVAYPAPEPRFEILDPVDVAARLIEGVAE